MHVRNKTGEILFTSPLIKKPVHQIICELFLFINDRGI